MSLAADEDKNIDGKTADLPNVSSFDVIKEWINGNDLLSARSDESFILQYLTISEFNVEKTKERITRYNDLRRIMPTWFESLDDDLARVIFFEKPVFCNTKFLPDSETSIFVLQLGNIDLNEISVDQINNIGKTTAEGMLEDVRYQLLGVDLLLDFENISLQTLTVVTPNYIWKMIDLWQTAMPIKINRFHVLNAPMILSGLISAAAYLFSNGDKLINHGSNLDSLHEAIPINILPLEYGGTAGSINYLANETWKLYIHSKSKH